MDNHHRPTGRNRVQLLGTKKVCPRSHYGYSMISWVFNGASIKMIPHGFLDFSHAFIPESENVPQSGTYCNKLLRLV